MNDAHYHLLFNHLPIIIPIVGLLVLIGGFMIKSDLVKRTAYCIFILGSLATIAAISTGEGAEHAVEGIEGITRDVIHEHEEVAEFFTILSYILGGLSLLALWSNLKRKTYRNYVAFIVLIFSCVVLYYAQKTGNTGGEIRHTEIRNESVMPG